MAVAATAGSAAFIAWDANDRKGGVGVTRAVTATATAALIVADYKLRLAGLEKNSPPFLDARNRVHERSAARLLRLCERNGGLYTKAGQFISTASGMPAPYQRHLSKLQDSARPLEWSDVREMVANELSPRAEHLVNFGGGNDARRPGSRRHGVVRRGRGERGETERGGDERARYSPAASAGRRRLANSIASPTRGVAGAGAQGGDQRRRGGGGEGTATGTEATVRRGPRDHALHHRRDLRCVSPFDFSFLVPDSRQALEELDSRGRVEAARGPRALADDARMVTPKIHWSLTTGRVLTMEYVRGVKVDDGPGLRARRDRPRGGGFGARRHVREDARVPRVRARGSAPGQHARAAAAQRLVRGR